MEIMYIVVNVSFIKKKERFLRYVLTLFFNPSGKKNNIHNGRKGIQTFISSH